MDVLGVDAAVARRPRAAPPAPPYRISAYAMMFAFTYRALRISWRRWLGQTFALTNVVLEIG